MFLHSMRDARCEALFASHLQQSDCPSPEVVAAAINHAVRRFGAGGCVSHVAQEFGDHPEAARARMLWAKSLLSDLPAAV